MANLKELEERVKSLEMIAHPPVKWEEKIRILEEELKGLVEKLEKYGI